MTERHEIAELPFTMKKTVIILLGMIIVLNGDVDADNSNFHLKLSYLKKERSKDSSSTNTEISIQNGIVNYSVTHGGRSRLPDLKKKYILSAKKKKLLVEYIKRNYLNKNIKEKKPAVSPGINVHLVLEIKIGKKSTEANISGAENIWGRAGRKQSSNLKNLEYCDNVQSLLVYMKNTLGFKDIEL